MEKIELVSRQQHVKTVILKYIRDNAPNGEQLPSEIQFAQMLGVSRNTVREALRALESEGVIYSRHGVGTFSMSVGKGMRSSINLLERPTKIISDNGHVPGIVDLKVRVVAAKERIAHSLSIAPGVKVLCIDSIRTADGVPIVYLQDYLIYEKGLEEAYKNYSGESLFEFLSEHSDIRIGHSVCDIKAAIGSKAIRDKLELPKSTALVLLEQTHYSKKGQPVLYSDSYFNSDKFNFTIVRKSL